jgi:hypothetical protein
MKRQLSLLVLLVATLVWGIADASAAQRVSTTFPMPVRLQAAVEASGCENAPGPQITLNGALTLGGLGVDLIFRNNEKGTHTATEEAVAKVVLIPEGQSVSVPKQPVLGGVGGNPFIWVQLVDAAGNPLSGAIFLGRCVQGLSNLSADFFLPSTAVAEVEAEGCYNNPGPYITLSGQLALTGLNARIMFANNDNPVGGPHDANVEASVDVVVIPAGQSIQIPKQPVLGGVGGNPWISVLFRDGAGEPLSGEFLLGRCVQLSK